MGAPRNRGVGCKIRTWLNGCKSGSRLKELRGCTFVRGAKVEDTYLKAASKFEGIEANVVIIGLVSCISG